MNALKLAPVKWFLTLKMIEGDHHAEITLSKDSGYAEDSDEYMRVSGICSLANAKKMVAAPIMLEALNKIAAAALGGENVQMKIYQLAVDAIKATE